MTFLPHIVSSKFYPPFLPKLYSTFYMLPKNRMKYSPHQLYKFPVHKYLAIVPVLFSIFLLDQTHIARISFLVIWELRCHSPASIWIVTFSLQLIQNNWELFELQITHTGIIANFCLKPGISFYEDFHKGENVVIVYSLYL